MARRAIKNSDFNVDITAYADNDIISQGATSYFDLNDITIQSISATTYNPAYQITVSQSGIFTGQTLTLESSNPSVAAVSNNRISRLSNGQSDIVVKSDRFGKWKKELDFTQVSGNTQYTKYSYKSGTIARNIEDKMIEKINATSGFPGNFNNFNIFSSLNTRNPNFIYHGMTGLTAIMSLSTYNFNPLSGATANYSNQHLTPIAPDIAIGAGHYVTANTGAQPYGHSVGMQVQFVTADNQVITRTVQSSYTSQPWTSNPAQSVDINIVRFSSPLPDNIGYLRVLNPYSTCNSTDMSNYGLLGTFFTRQNFVNIGRYSFSTTPNPTYYTYSDQTMIRLRDVTYELTNGVYNSLSSGDSGGPVAALINNEIVLLGYNENKTLFNVIPALGITLKDFINARMTDLGSSYQITEYS
jgi:hypothetical protein